MFKKIIVLSLTSLFLGSVSASDAQSRYVSLAPGTTEILFALGLDDEVVGVSQQCDFPARALDKDKIGTFSQPNIEKVVSLRPDIVFCTGLEQYSAAEKLRRLKLNVCMSHPGNLRELYASIEEIGRLVGRADRARQVVAEMKAKIAPISEKVSAVPREERPKVLVELWHSPIMTAGPGSFVDELIGIAGGVNVADGLGKPYANIAFEEVLRRNPDCVFLTYMGDATSVESLRSAPGWTKISAVVHHRVFDDVDPDLLLTPGPRLADGVVELHRRLYP